MNTEMVMETFYGALTRPKYVLINLTTMLIDHFCNPLQSADNAFVLLKFHIPSSTIYIETPSG